MDRIRNESVAKAAHRLWQEAGCPEGRELEFWLRAERITPRIRYFSVAPEPTRGGE